ncbi:MAG TPA: hypothetical protein VNP04_01085 [Alphaproteobacteria bacterium]|nr:hypothetical protein [Alphaproteobacteria bacterium]
MVVLVVEVAEATAATEPHDARGGKLFGVLVQASALPASVLMLPTGWSKPYSSVR